MLSVVIMSVIMQSVVILSIVMLSVVMQSVVILSIVKLSVVMQSVVMLSCVVPSKIILLCAGHESGRKILLSDEDFFCHLGPAP